jgi:hypothetical protein
VPPLLIKQERLIDEVVGPFLPIFADEPSVLRQRLDARFRPAAFECALISVVGKADSFPRRFINKLEPLAGRKHQLR